MSLPHDEAKILTQLSLGTLTEAERLAISLKVQARIAATAAASRLWEGSFPREVDMEEFISSCTDLEEWILRN